MAGLSRKTVTVLFADVVDSTPLGEAVDAEAVRVTMERYFEEMRPVIERHGGTVEKYIGDAIMAVFGIPVVHEDDALRAVRAACEMREALATLNRTLQRPLSIRTALNTGEVVTGDGHTLITGDAVNVAARLERAAEPGEILIGATTHALVRDAVLAEPVDSLSLKGKSAPVAAARVTAVLPDAPGHVRRLDAEIVGRDRESDVLRTAYARVVDQRSSHLFTIFGTAGVGKSKLASELLLEMAAHGATTLVGRCLSYGEGITYWPLRDIVHAVGDLEPLIEPADARAVAGAVGLSEGSATAAEIAYAVRKLVETLARNRPVVLEFDDVQWAEPTFLDLVEQLADSIRTAPVLIVCLARPELLEDRPFWGGGKVNATTILLEPLDAKASDRLIANLGGDEIAPDLRRRIAEVAEGNPLFLEEMVRMVRDDPTASAVPPTIHALLAARLERLPPPEREAVAAAAVVGRFFAVAAVEELVGHAVSDHLAALDRKEVIRPQRVPYVEGDAYRFRHVLIRDAAYDALPKARRAEMHEQLADWLDETAAGRRGEVEELVGWHLEQAATYRAELGAADERVAARAAAALAAVGRRAADRGDMRAAAGLLTRATVLWRDDERARLGIAPPLAAALAAIGEPERAHAILARALASEAAAADERLRAHVALAHVALRDVSADTVREARRAIEIFAAADDDLGLSKAHQLLAHEDAANTRFAAAADRLERALLHARRAGNRRQISLASNALAAALYFGPAPAVDAIARCDELVADDPGAAVAAVVRCIVAGLHAVQGKMDVARTEFFDVVATFESLGVTGWLAYARLYRGVAELGAGALDDARDELAAAVTSLERAHDEQLALAAAYLARAQCALGAIAEADELAETALAAAANDPVTQAIATGARARIALARGTPDVAARVARSAVEIASRGDAVVIHADALLELAEALEACGDARGANDAAADALRLYERKGHLVGAASARRLAPA